jgi:hypothetical protein
MPCFRFARDWLNIQELAPVKATAAARRAPSVTAAPK